jgi:hypothetical protein
LRRKEELLELDYKDIQERFNKVISFSQGIEQPHTDGLFEQWAQNKLWFIKTFNGLIYEYPEPVSFELNKQEKINKIYQFADKVYELYHNDELNDFIIDNKNDFFENILTKDYKKVPKGMKIIKAFKFFESNKDILTDIQNMASQVIQEDRMTGTLCLSVHPLDFLSTSENAHNWRSCHALDGEYKAGNLAYMGDKGTIIAYIKSDKGDTFKLPDFPEDVPWNSKKWRSLIFFSDRRMMMFAGRQYPFTLEDTMDFIRVNIINKYIHKFTEWDTKKITSMVTAGHNIPVRPAIPVGTKLIALDDLIIDTYPAYNSEDTLYYNDLKRSNCYDPMYAYRLREFSFFEDISVPDSERFQIGSNVKCLRCGRNYISNSDSMMCEFCWNELEE